MLHSGPLWSNQNLQQLPDYLLPTGGRGRCQRGAEFGLRWLEVQFGRGLKKRKALKIRRRRADIHCVSQRLTKISIDSEHEKAIVGKLFERVMDHIPAQYERQSGRCVGCGKELPSAADGLLRLSGELECISCALKGHTSPR